MQVTTSGLVALFIGIFSLNAFAQIDANVKMKENVRGSRYCEIIVVKGSIFSLTGTIYNTLGKNDCPAGKWNAIDFDKLKKELNAKEVVKNGPRYFLMDKIGETNESLPSTTFQGLEMVERAKVSLSKKKKPYEETTFKRSTYYVFSKGSETYQLVSPNAAYIMQSYSQIADPKLKEDNLKDLAKRLKLPKDWSYKVVKLKEDLILKTVENKEAFVIQDDLTNTYQKIK